MLHKFITNSTTAAAATSTISSTTATAAAAASFFKATFKPGGGMYSMIWNCMRVFIKRSM